MHIFSFNLRQVVKLVESGETGTVIGRAQYTASEDSYLIRYKAADGRQVQDWWGESAIEVVETDVRASTLADITEALEREGATRVGRIVGIVVDDPEEIRRVIERNAAATR